MNYAMGWIQWGLDFAKQNPIVAGAIGLWGMATITMLTRQLPTTIFRFLKRQFTVTLMIRSGERAVFEPVLRWFESQSACQRFRSLIVQTQRLSLRPLEDDVVAIKSGHKRILSIGEGKHYFWQGFRPFSIRRDIEQRVSGSWGEISETIVITSLGRSQVPIRTLINDIMYESEKSIKQLTTIYNCEGGGWSLFGHQLPRKLDSVFVPDVTRNLVVGTIQRFIDSQDYYTDRGIPYRLGILFCGVPGSGKTSMINALASHFNRNIKLIDVSNINNKDLTRALSTEAQGAIMVIEDIDGYDGNNTAQPPRQHSQDASMGGQLSGISLAINKLTLSGLLCAIDGASSSDGRILIMTTNADISTLPPELMRPGRIDLVIKFALMGNSEAIKMIEYLYRDKNYRVPKEFRIKADISAAQLQGLILTNRDCPQKVIDEIRESQC